MNNKVIIEIIEGYHYNKSVKNGASFTSVGFSANTYGSGYPCDTPEDIQRAIQHHKAWIIKEGDIPIVRDLREKSKLTKFFKGGN